MTANLSNVVVLPRLGLEPLVTAGMLLAAGRRSARSGSRRSSRFFVLPRFIGLAGGRPDRLGVSLVDHGSLRVAECSYAVADPEELEVRVDHLLEQSAQVGLGLPLRRRFPVLWIAGVKRPTVQQDPRSVLQIDVAQRPPLQPVTVDVMFVQSGGPETTRTRCLRRHP